MALASGAGFFPSPLKGMSARVLIIDAHSERTQPLAQALAEATTSHHHLLQGHLQRFDLKYYCHHPLLIGKCNLLLQVQVQEQQ